MTFIDSLRHGLAALVAVLIALLATPAQAGGIVTELIPMTVTTATSDDSQGESAPPASSTPRAPAGFRGERNAAVAVLMLALMTQPARQDAAAPTTGTASPSEELRVPDHNVTPPAAGGCAAAPGADGADLLVVAAPLILGLARARRRRIR